MGASRPPSAMKITMPYDRGDGVRGTIHADTSDPDRFTVQTSQNVDGIIDFCRAKQEATRFDRHDGLMHVAEVPIPIYEQAVLEGWDTPDGWKAWLNRPENACFRTWRGRV